MHRFLAKQDTLIVDVTSDTLHVKKIPQSYISLTNS
jgi:hypothetical protein